jgi:hypothetical protein
VALARMPFAEAEVREAGLEVVSTAEVPSPLTYHVVTRHRESRPAVIEFCRRLQAAALEGIRS